MKYSLHIIVNFSSYEWELWNISSNVSSSFSLTQHVQVDNTVLVPPPSTRASQVTSHSASTTEWGSPLGSLVFWNLVDLKSLQSTAEILNQPNLKTSVSAVHDVCVGTSSLHAYDDKNGRLSSVIKFEDSQPDQDDTWWFLLPGMWIPDFYRLFDILSCFWYWLPFTIVTWKQLISFSLLFCKLNTKRNIKSPEL